jgi:hypothetical protein
MALKITIEKVDNGALIESNAMIPDDAGADPDSSLPVQVIITEADLVVFKQFILLTKNGNLVSVFNTTPLDLNAGVADIWAQIYGS